jgi:hypothetical protein
MKRGSSRYGVALLAAVTVGWLIPASVACTQAPQAEEGEESGAVATPRMPDGKPDLSGRWGGGGGGGGRRPTADANGVLSLAGGYRKNNPTNGERDSGLDQRFGPNFPLYKPEYWERVDFLDNHGNVEDSAFHCMPQGLPRIGPPVKIVQTPTEVVFVYNHRNTARVIPTDGRPHHPVNSQDTTYMGDSVGKWEGDELVIDVIGFNDSSWLAWPGYFHTFDMRVEERLRREGNTLHYQSTVYDPEVLMEPWKLNPRTLQLNTSDAPYIEDPPCIESDGANLATRERG